MKTETNVKVEKVQSYCKIPIFIPLDVQVFSSFHLNNWIVPLETVKILGKRTFTLYLLCI